MAGVDGAKFMLDYYIYEHFRKRDCHKSATVFLEESKFLLTDPASAIQFLGESTFLFTDPAIDVDSDPSDDFLLEKWTAYFNTYGAQTKGLHSAMAELYVIRSQQIETFKSEQQHQNRQIMEIGHFQGMPDHNSIDCSVNLNAAGAHPPPRSLELRSLGDDLLRQPTRVPAESVRSSQAHVRDSMDCMLQSVPTELRSLGDDLLRQPIIVPAETVRNSDAHLRDSMDCVLQSVPTHGAGDSSTDPRVPQNSPIVASSIGDQQGPTLMGIPILMNPGGDVPRDVPNPRPIPGPTLMGIPILMNPGGDVSYLRSPN